MAINRIPHRDDDWPPAEGGSVHYPNLHDDDDAMLRPDRGAAGLETGGGDPRDIGHLFRLDEPDSPEEPDDVIDDDPDLGDELLQPDDTDPDDDDDDTDGLLSSSSGSKRRGRTGLSLPKPTLPKLALPKLALPGEVASAPWLRPALLGSAGFVAAFAVWTGGQAEPVWLRVCTVLAVVAGLAAVGMRHSVRACCGLAVVIFAVMLIPVTWAALPLAVTAMAAVLLVDRGPHGGR